MVKERVKIIIHSFYQSRSYFITMVDGKISLDDINNQYIEVIFEYIEQYNYLSYYGVDIVKILYDNYIKLLNTMSRLISYPRKDDVLILLTYDRLKVYRQLIENVNKICYEYKCCAMKLYEIEKIMIDMKLSFYNHRREPSLSNCLFDIIIHYKPLTESPFRILELVTSEIVELI